MKRYGNLYGKIWDIDNIKEAHKNARKGKKKKNGEPYDDIKMVDEDLDKYCRAISDTLRDKAFVNESYDVFIKLDKGKEREIYRLPYYPDKIVHHAIMQVLEPIWKPTLIADTYQSIKDRGVHKALHKLDKVVKKNPDMYYLQIDVKKFYPSVDNEIMKQVLRKKIKCKDTLWLLDTIVSSIKGLPIGNYISQYLGNLYLSELDHYAKEILKAKHYFRYCDDIVILHHDKKFLHDIKKKLDIILTDLRLEVKSNHKVDMVSEGLNFLGVVHYGKYKLLRKSIAKRYKRCTDLQKPSYGGWLKVTDSYNLQKSKERKIHDTIT